MTRVLTGDALVNEDPRLQARINQLLDKLEATLKQSLRVAATQGAEGGAPAAEGDIGPRANAALCYIVGRWHQFAKSGFKRPPAADFDRQAVLLLG
jgi:TetR/AcrR family transcriptional regulator